MTGPHRSTDELIAETYADTTGVPAEDLEAAADFTDDSLSAEDVIASHDLPAEHRPTR
ncbi:MAG: hypothetical protein OXU81_23135 [Gammaproteobacteria bacterium]|nr:hypothetical protein [Gammaproteobacteria bacterium]